MLRPSTYTRSFLESTRRMRPRLPRSLPPTTITSSPAFKRAGIGLQHLRSEGDDPHEVALAQLARHRAEDARPARVVLVVDQHRGVLVKRDVGAVLAPVRLAGAD